MAPRIHDADLCERIRILEERVRELEARPPVIAYPPFYVYPYWHTTPVYHPWTVWSGTTTDPNITISGTAADSSGVQSTYTLGMSD